MVAKNAVVRGAGDGTAVGGDVATDSFESIEYHGWKLALAGWDFLRRVRVRMSRELAFAVVFQRHRRTRREEHSSHRGGKYRFFAFAVVFYGKLRKRERGDVRCVRFGCFVWGAFRVLQEANVRGPNGERKRVRVVRACVRSGWLHICSVYFESCAV